MKLTPAYVRSEMKRIEEERIVNAQPNPARDEYMNVSTRNLANCQANGALQGLLDMVLRFGLENEMVA